MNLWQFTLLLTQFRQVVDNPVSWGCRIHWLHLGRGVRYPPTSILLYDTKQSNDEAAVLELWEMLSTPSLPMLPGPGVVAPDKVLSMSQKELFYI